MRRWGGVLILALSGILLACQLQYVLPASESATPPRPTRTLTPGPGAVLPTEPPAVLPSLPPGPEPTVPPPQVMATTTANLRVRAAPSASSQQIALLNKGETVRVIGRNAASDWLQIVLPSNPNVSGWIAANYAQVSGPLDSIPVVSGGSSPLLPPASQPYPGLPPYPAPPQSYP